MADTDYYTILGVSRSASAEDIRKAYRKLARENHPDAKKDDPQAAQRFQQIQEAYDVLGDATKRSQYDQYGPDFVHAAAAAAAARAGGFRPGGRPGQQPVDFGDYFGGSGGVEFDFSDLFGGGGPGRGSRRPSRGADIQAKVSIPFETSVRGGTVDVRVEQNGQFSTLGVKIPAGIQPDAVIRLAGQGEKSLRGGASGDLLLTVAVQPHPIFRRDGRDLIMDLPLSPAEAVLGAKVEVPTLSEGPVLMTVPPGTSSGMKLRLRGKGVLDAASKETGDQFCVIKIVVPARPSEELQNLYRQLQPLEPKPRTGLW